MPTDADRLPNLLIIGAAKAGTTTLFRDLDTHPRIFFPVHKEPSCLAHDHVLTEAGRAEYAALFRDADPDQWLAEASTVYTKLPRVTGVPGRALRVVGPELKVIYIVREPVSRARSLHAHLYNDGELPREFDRAVACDHRLAGDLIANGKYAMQIQPWIDTFGREHVHIIHFEDYVQRRAETINAVCDFLGIPARPDLLRIDEQHNVTAARRYGRGPIGRTIRKLTSNKWYRFHMRRMIPDRAVEVGKRLLFRPPAAPPIGPSEALLDEMIREFDPQAEQLRQIMGLSEPLWDFAQVRQKHLADAPRAETS